jgi:hypothetical protein
MRDQGFHKSINSLQFLTENRQSYKFIIIMIILPFPHDSEICPDGVQNTASRHKRAGGATLSISIYKRLAVARHDVAYS